MEKHQRRVQAKQNEACMERDEPGGLSSNKIDVLLRSVSWVLRPRPHQAKVSLVYIFYYILSHHLTWSIVDISYIHRKYIEMFHCSTISNYIIEEDEADENNDVRKQKKAPKPKAPKPVRQSSASASSSSSSGTFLMAPKAAEEKDVVISDSSFGSPQCSQGGKHPKGRVQMQQSRNSSSTAI